MAADNKGEKKMNRGHTLLELIVALAVVCILMAAAIPSFHEYIVKSKIDAIKGEVLKAATAQERFYAAKGFYANTTDPLVNYGLASNIINGVKLSTGMLIDPNTGMGYWIAGNKDIDDSADAYNECWVYYGRNTNTGTSANIINLYDDRGDLEKPSAVNNGGSPAVAIPNIAAVCK